MSRYSFALLAIPFFLVLESNEAFAQRALQRNEAIVGEPFGVAKVSIPITRADRELLRINGLLISEENGRVHYPVFSSGALKTVIDMVAGDTDAALPKSMTVYFLFTGNEPFTAKVYTSTTFTIRIEPATARPLQRNLLTRAWWREYNAAARTRKQQGDYPPILETYLTAMLGERLQLPKPLIERTADAILVKDQIQNAIDFFLGAEQKHLKLLRETMTGETAMRGKATLPLPPDPLPQRPFIQRDLKGDESRASNLEEIAAHVPQECFYVRFGQWQNLVWLQRLGRDYGGDIGRMAILRGIEPNSITRVEEQLCVEQDPLAETFGQTVIKDVAFIGRDLNTAEGAAIGILFQQRNALLTSQLQGGRAKILKREKENGAIQETVTIAGRKVDLISTPDNRLRSYYAQHDDCHLIANSRAMIERFFEAGNGKGALIDTSDFIQTRQAYPITSEDTAFVYMPTDFFRGLLSSKYQVETMRRQQALVDLELVQLATAAAKAEGFGLLSPDELVAAGFLPEGFTQRPDFSGPIVSDLVAMDSMRGARGYFKPVPDVQIDRITEFEGEQLEKQNEAIGREWASMIPVVITMKRMKVESERPNRSEVNESKDGAVEKKTDRTNNQSRQRGLERIQFTANVTSLLGKQFDFFIQLLGEPTKYKHGTSPRDIMHFHTSVKGGLLFKSVPQHQMFVAIQNEPTPVVTVKPTGFFGWLQLLKGFPGYVGAWPAPGFLDTFTPQLARADKDGFSYSRLLDLHRMQAGEYSVLAFDKTRLFQTRPYLGAVQTEMLGQFHASIGDLSKSELVPLIETLFYQRALQASLGNVKLLNAMSQQLKIDPKAARSEVEKLLDGKLICSLEGDYQPLPHPNGQMYWTSSRLPSINAQRIPIDYRANLLTWFRGLNLTMLVQDDQIMVYGYFDMQRKIPARKNSRSDKDDGASDSKNSEKTTDSKSQPSSGFSLPGLNLFGPAKSKESDKGNDAKGKKDEKQSGR